ncbi:unnamed protein product [Prorocentrum cordatum]|uniref:PAS domain-containing protein n=1 Tax=Prorocentrum cordatum TaxID=2364126 RepID=A0ABN9SX06_9DINO|nr:unnamed protein product [Polarella glacialis]
MASTASRRNLWLIYGVVVAGEILVDLVNSLLGRRPEGLVFWIVDGSELCLSLLLMYLPPKTLKSDVVLSVCFTLQFLTYLVDPQGFTIVAMTLVGKVFLCHALGVHSLAVNVFASCSMLMFLTCLPVRGEDAIQASISLIVVISFVMTLFEWLLASSFLQLGEHIDALHNLLDNSAEGCCTVMRHTGIVTHVSKRLQDVFGREMLGANVLDFVDLSDHVRVRGLFEYGQLNVTEPVLATCLQPRLVGRLGASEFDARLVPYRVTEADVQISFQRVGEARMTRGRAVARAGARTGAEAAAEAEIGAGSGAAAQPAAWAPFPNGPCQGGLPLLDCPCPRGGAARGGEQRRFGLQGGGGADGPSSSTGPLAVDPQGVACSPLGAGDSPAAQGRRASGPAPGGAPDAGDDLRIAFDPWQSDADASSSASSSAANDVDRQQHVGSVSVVVDVFSETLRVNQMILHFSSDIGAADVSTPRQSSMTTPCLADWLHADELEYTREWIVESAKAGASETLANVTGHGPIRFYCGQRTFVEAADVSVERLDIRSEHWRAQAGGKCGEEEEDEEEGEQEDGGDETDGDHDCLSEVDGSEEPLNSLNMCLRLNGVTKMFWPPWADSLGYRSFVKHAIRRYGDQVGLSKRRSLRPISEHNRRCKSYAVACEIIASENQPASRT